MDDGCGIDGDTFAALRERYTRRYPVRLCACDASGRVCMGEEAVGGNADLRALAVREALRWGEPVVVPGVEDCFVWAGPLMHNAVLLGGVVAEVAEATVFPADLEEPAVDIRQACRDLLELLVDGNHCNASLLAEHRERHQEERLRAEAIHERKQAGSSGEDVVLGDEVGLVTAVREGDRGRAREIINRRLVAIYHLGGASSELTKSRLVELVVVLSRAAIESGGKQEELLGANFQHLLELRDIGSEEGLAAWLRRVLDRIMDAIERHRLEPSDVLLRDALGYMEANCCEESMSRDEVARRAGISPSRFSRLIKERIGRSFTDQLNHLRISHAKHLLENSELSLLHIAFGTGFKDPSYFTKVFRRHVGMTPKDYRSYNRGR